MDAKQLAEIKKRAEAATPAPWMYGVYDVTPTFKDIKQHSCVCHPETLDLYALTGPADDRQAQLDAEFIAAARQDIPALIAEIESCWMYIHGYASSLDEALNSGDGVYRP